MPTEEEIIDKVMLSADISKHFKDFKIALKQKDQKSMARILDNISLLFRPKYTAHVSLRTSLGKELCSRGTAVSEIAVEYPITKGGVFLRITITPKAKEGKKADILLVGLFFASKTTLTRSIKSGYLEKTDPTTGMEIEFFNYKKLRFSLQDMAGHESYRAFWNSMLVYSLPKVIYWVVDSADHASFSESIAALDKHIIQTTKTKSIPIILIANKQDLPLAASPNELDAVFEASKRFQARVWKVIGTSAKVGTGLYELLDNLHSLCSSDS